MLSDKSVSGNSISRFDAFVDSDLIISSFFSHCSYRPDLVELISLKGKNVQECNEIAFQIIEKEFGIPRVMTSAESTTLENIESKVWLSYLEQVCEVFRGEIPHVKHPKLDLDKLRESKKRDAPDFSQLLKYGQGNARKLKSPTKEIEEIERPRRSKKLDLTAVKESLAIGGNRTPDNQSRRARKRRSHDKIGNVSVVSIYLRKMFEIFLVFVKLFKMQSIRTEEIRKIF